MLFWIVTLLLVMSVGGEESDVPAPFVVQVVASFQRPSFTGGGGSFGAWTASAVQGSDCCSADNFEPPNISPRDPATWRSEWCVGGSGGACPDKAITEWVSRHKQIRREAERGNVPPGSFLACKASGGIGNFVVGMVSCLAFAMVTGRSLLLAPPPKNPHLEQRHHYNIPVEMLFDFPLDMSLRVLGANVTNIPVLTDAINDPDKTGLKLVDFRIDDLLCRNLSMAYTAPIAVLPAHLWLGVLPHNVHHAPFFTEHFGRDELGVSDVVSFLGSWLLRPKPHLLSRLKALARAVSQKPDGSRLHILGLQARTGHKGTDFPERVVSPHGVGPEFVRCALSFVPNELRGSPQGWIVVGDGSVVKLEMLQRIANLEGPIVAAANERVLRGMGLPKEYFAAGSELGAKSVEEVFLDADLQAIGFALAIFASGSRAVILADPPDWSTEAGMEAAIIEMWLLSYARVLVVTEDSTFWVPAVTFLRKGRAKARAYVFTRNKRCYPLPTREPVTDGGLRSREMTKSPCYDDSILNPTLTWQPLEFSMDM